MHTYMWHVEKQDRWTYLQGRNRHTDVESKYMDAKKGKGGWDELGDWDGCSPTIMYKIDN